MKNDFIVIDDIIPLSWQNDIANTIMSNNFPWYFTVDVTLGFETPEKERAPALYHILRQNYETCSNFMGKFGPLAHVAAARVNFDLKDIFEARLFLQFPLSDQFLPEKIGRLHVDPAPDNIVVLYYILDADGDTILVDKKRKKYGEQNNEILDDHPILAKVSPKKGRCLIFDGDYYHTATQPSSSIRSVINFNLV